MDVSKANEWIAHRRITINLDFMRRVIDDYQSRLGHITAIALRSSVKAIAL